MRKLGQLSDVANALDQLHTVGRALVSIDYSASTKPRSPTDADYDAAANLPADAQLNGSWPVVLYTWSATFTQFWKRWQTAQEAIEVGMAALRGALDRSELVELLEVVATLDDGLEAPKGIQDARWRPLPAWWADQLGALPGYVRRLRALSRVAGVGNEGEQEEAPKDLAQPPVNVRLLDLIHRKPESKDWAARNLAAELGCAESTVKGTTTWKHLMKLRARTKSDRAVGLDGR